MYALFIKCKYYFGIAFYLAIQRKLSLLTILNLQKNPKFRYLQLCDQEAVI